MKSYDVVALGELLIDFTGNGISEQGNPLFEANPGGAPCNVLSMLCQCGKKTAFIGKVGDDMFGAQLENAIKNVGINSDGLVKTSKVNTTLAFVHTKEGGDRDFSFYRKPGADMMLAEDELNEAMLKDTKVFHYGSLSMTDAVCEKATKKAIDIAKEAGAILTFDPNLREPLWDSLDKAKEMIAYGMSKCDVLKISDNEVLWFTGCNDYDAAVSSIRKQYPNIKLLLLSLGKDGSRAYINDEYVFEPALVNPNTIETTGAGDTFFGMVINYVIDNGLMLSGKQLSEMLKYANTAASIITTRKGALSVMPTISEIEEAMK